MTPSPHIQGTVSLNPRAETVFRFLVDLPICPKTLLDDNLKQMTAFLDFTFSHTYSSAYWVLYSLCLSHRKIILKESLQVDNAFH